MKKKLDCPHCSKPSLAHSRGKYIVQAKEIGNSLFLFCVCSSCKSVQMIEIEKSITQRGRYIHCTNNNWYKIYKVSTVKKKEDVRLILKCMRCNGEISINLMR